MSRRDLVLLFALALLFNLALAAFVPGPLIEDDAYYFGGALRLAGGQGFTEPYLWNYLGNPTALPQSSHLYWMPLTSIVAALSMLVFGQSFAAARLPFLLLASLLPLVTYYIAHSTTGIRRHALGAGLIAIFCGYYAIYWATTDSFAVYGVVVPLTFIVASRGSETRSNDLSRSSQQTAEAVTTNNGWRWWLVAGIGAGLAHLTRADGVLALFVVLWLVITTRQRPERRAAGGFPPHVVEGRGARKSSGSRAGAAPFDYGSQTARASAQGAYFVLLAIGYLLVMLPWFSRNLVVAGSPLGAGGAGTLWLTEYNDIFDYPSNVTPARYFAAGVEIILRGKLEALATNLQRVIAEQGLIFLTPLIVVGLWRLRGHKLYQTVMTYAALLYGAMTLAFSFPGARGGLFHSSAALLPFYFPAALVGLDATVDGIATRLKHWQPELAKRNFTILLIVFAAALTLAVSIPRLSKLKEDPAYALLRDLPAEAVVMSNNPPGVWVATGHPGLPLPNGDGEAVIALADKFHVRYVVMDRNITPGLVPLYESDGTEWLRLIKQEGDVKLFEVIR